MRTARSTRRKRPLTALLGALAGMIGVLVLGGPGSATAQAQEEPALATGLHISDGRLVEGNGNDFIMRGVNHAHTWYPGETQSLADVKALGSNTVRVVLSNGYRWSENSAADVASVVAQCKANRLICVLEVHDTTGYGEEAAADTLDGAADYWIGLQSVLTGEEDYVIINIGNEPWGNTDPEGWTAPTIAAVEKLRNAGFEHTIMVDAPNWGQDWQGVMRATAQSVYEADTTGNLIFSIHMYSVYDTAQKITDYLGSFVQAGLPLVIGEFGGPPDEWGDPDEDAMLAAAEQYRLGYLAWSWSGNTDPILDLAIDFDPSRLSSWGERIFHGPNGIGETAREATVFDGEGGGEEPQPNAGCAVAYRVVGEWNGGFQGEIVIRNTGTAPLDGWTLAFVFPSGQTVSSMWGGTATQSGSGVSVAPAAYNAGIPAGGTVTVGFLADKGSANAAPTGFTLSGAACTTG
ncbi:cellulase family glycosylhydrolase [Streptomyces sp. XC 2026]|uniref:cellulase family glycosylhydrolase n=1 Tax=Streptomyces sp. XC 2026 TaxID=2782004 RepID=UPI001906F8A3|nr:cellulase family glycosylhydrolase [Streptomyces sp. XC 2026]QQN76494.1 cellulase family glycosylhydrolase [Streptomyces sp. XC 2026]